MTHRRLALAIASTLLSLPTAPGIARAVDADGDGVEDSLDNCRDEANADQTDTNLDGYGNACDGDFDNDGVVDARDYAIFSAAYGSHGTAPESSNWNPDVDCDAATDGVIGAADFLCYVRQATLGRPGPSGLACAGSFPCPCNAIPTHGECVLETAWTGQNPNRSYVPPSIPATYSGCRGPNPGPRILVDTLHQNFYRPRGRYWPFWTLLGTDGSVVVDTQAPLVTTATAPLEHLLSSTRTSTTRTDILVVAGPNIESSEEDAEYLDGWVKAGGSLLLIVDHSPHDAAAAILAKMFPAAPAPAGEGFRLVRTDVAGGQSDPYPFVPSPFENPSGTHGILDGASVISCPSGICPEIGRVETFGGEAFCPHPLGTACPDQGAGALLRLPASYPDPPNGIVV